MALARVHTEAADGTFSSEGATAWNASHGVTGATSGGIPYFDSATSEASSALLAANSLVIGGGAGAAPFTSANLTYSSGILTVTSGSVYVPTAGTATVPSYSMGATNTGWYASASNVVGLSITGAACITQFGTTRFLLKGDNSFEWATGTTNAGGTTDGVFAHVGTNAFMFCNTAAGTAGAPTSRTEINKAVTAFTDGVAKTALTLTIPNAAHSASYLVRVTGSIGAGGAIGANEANATNCYVVSLARTAGVNAVAGISAAFGASTAAVAGATTVTCTAGLGAVGGAVGASNTITLDVTITKGGGASDNHTLVCTASLLNANATGITIA